MNIDRDTLRWIVDDALDWNLSCEEARVERADIQDRIKTLRRLQARTGRAPNATREALEAAEAVPITEVRASDHFHYPGCTRPGCTRPGRA